MTPKEALAIIRESRPLCEPNDGFMEQLNIYHQMKCPDDVIGHPLYSRWMYRREVEDSVACGRAPEINSVLFEDTQPHQQEESGPLTEIKCRKCRYVYFVPLPLCPRVDFFLSPRFSAGYVMGEMLSKTQPHARKYPVYHPTRGGTTKSAT